MSVPTPQDCARAPGCEQNIVEIQEHCGKPGAAVACEIGKDGTRYSPHVMCRGHAKMHARDETMEVTWVLSIQGAT